LLAEFDGDFRRYSECLMNKERTSKASIVSYPIPAQAPQKVAEPSPPYAT